jgi:hypothetical protein
MVNCAPPDKDKKKRLQRRKGELESKVNGRYQKKKIVKEDKMWAM